jgi:hypothetical protein
VTLPGVKSHSHHQRQAPRPPGARQQGFAPRSQRAAPRRPARTQHRSRLPPVATRTPPCEPIAVGIPQLTGHLE